MAKKNGAGSKNGEKFRASENVKRADIVTAAQSMAGPTDFSKGYGEIMHGVNINKGASKSARRGGAD